MGKKTKQICKTCGGHKYIRVEPRSNIRGMVIPGGAFAPCPDCTYTERVYRNIEKGWKNLFKAPMMEEGETSPLLDLVEENVWTTASVRDFRIHLRHVAIRKGPSWDFKVVSDKTLMTADFANMSIRGVEILDPDFEELERMASASLQVMTLSDLIEPPGLLIVQLGVKGRNRHLPEVLLETLSQREHLSKKTWIWDQPHRPLCENHHAFSEEVAAFMESWEYERVRINGSGTSTTTVSKQQGVFDMHDDGDEEPVFTISNLSGMGKAREVKQPEKKVQKKTRKTRKKR